MTPKVNTGTLLTLLLEKQVITTDVAEEVGRLQQESGKAPEAVLVEIGALTEDDLATFISDALHIRFIKLEDVEIDREAVKHVPAVLAFQHQLIPVRRSGNTLVVAFVNPTDTTAMRALKGVTDFEIIPFIARRDTIEHALYIHYGEPPTLSDCVESEQDTPLIRPEQLADDDRVSHMGRSMQINRQWTFDQYVEDSANQFPLSVARSIAEFQPESGYNPFHCWGPSGCGKSHLIHAIVNHIAARDPQKRMILTHGQSFADNLFEAIRDKKLNLFRYLYRELDLLVIDDADALMTRDWAQLELVDTFNEMRKNGRQLVLAAGSDLTTNPYCVAKLRDILHAGVVAGHGEYSVEAKMAMVSRKKGGIDLPQELLMYLVRRCGDRVSDLLSVLQQVSVLAMHGEKEITHEVVEDFIRISGIEIEDDSCDEKCKAKKRDSSQSARMGKKKSR